MSTLDTRALAAQKLAQRFLVSANKANPVPRGYRPDETPTEDGSERPRDRAGDIDPSGRRKPAIPMRQSAEKTREQYFKAIASQAGVPGVHGIHPDRLKRSNIMNVQSGALKRSFEEAPSGPPAKRARTNGPRPPPKAGLAKGKYYEPGWKASPAHDYTICIFKGKQFLQKIDISQKSAHVIGRMTDCDIQVNDNSVSRYHAVIQHGKGGVWIYDLGSTHRTFVNDHKQPLVNDGLVPIHQYKQILMYDIVMFGNCDLFYRLEGGPTRQEFEHSKG